MPWNFAAVNGCKLLQRKIAFSQKYYLLQIKAKPTALTVGFVLVLVEPRGVEALSDDGITDVFKGRVAFRVAWV